MKILVCGEGPTDIGCLRRGTSLADDVWEPGCVQLMVARILPNIELEFEPRLRKGVYSFDRYGRNSTRLQGLRGHAIKAFQAAETAQGQGCNAVIYMVDADSTEKSRWREIKGELEDGFRASTFEGSKICCIPRAIIEAWLIADETYWSEQISTTAPRVPKPEELWGNRDDPDSNFPKNVFARLCTLSELADDVESKWSVARSLDTALVARRCPLSFKQFRDDIAKLAYKAGPAP